MFIRENQNRKAVSLTDLRSGGEQTTSSATASESGGNQQSSYIDMYDGGIGHSSQPQSTTIINIVGCTTTTTTTTAAYDPNDSWYSHRSEDDSGIDTPSFYHQYENRRFLTGLRERRRILYGDRGGNSSSSTSSFKLLRGKIEKKVPYFLGGGTSSSSRRKSCNEIHLPSIHRGLTTRYTRAIRKGNCIYVGKAASLALENGDYDDFMSVPSSSSSTSDSPSYLLTSPPRCTLSFNPLTRRRHSLYAKVYSGGHRISSVAEEDAAPRSVVEGLDLNRSSSCVENGSNNLNHSALMPSGSLSVDLSTPQFESTLNRFNSLCITMKSGQMGFQRPEEYNSTTDSLCTQFSTMMLPTLSQSHSTGHSPFSSPHPIENGNGILSWTTQPSQSAQDLLTPNATDSNMSTSPGTTTFFTSNNPSTTSSTFFSTCLKN